MKKINKLLKSTEMNILLVLVFGYISAMLFGNDISLMGWLTMIASLFFVVRSIGLHYHELSVTASVEHRRTSECIMKNYKLDDRIKELELENRILSDKNNLHNHAYIVISNGRVRDIIPNIGLSATVIDLDIKRNFNKLGEEYVFEDQYEPYSLRDISESPMWEYINCTKCKDNLHLYSNKKHGN